MKSIIFHPDIQHDLKGAYDWYESQCHGLGEDFLNELESAYRVIIDLPDTWPMITKEFRRYLVNRFPYGIIYAPKNNSIFIVAVMHLSRKPDYWINRTD